MSKRVALSIKSMDGLDSLLDPRFGRAYAFLILDLETREVFAQFFNSAASAALGAGTAAAVAMQSNDVDAVISGRFGPKAVQALMANDIEMWTAPVDITAREAVERFATGSLEQMAVKVY
ncbi:MAG: NifB/NifX family molybdenum-iron cluster-binding protein [Myxococcota bacterium]|nr:NifB/NifX family molybdenum-iron cluster-binding protein [Myxococcota bacterium]